MFCIERGRDGTEIFAFFMARLQVSTPFLLVISTPQNWQLTTDRMTRFCVRFTVFQG